MCPQAGHSRLATNIRISILFGEGDDSHLRDFNPSTKLTACLVHRTGELAGNEMTDIRDGLFMYKRALFHEKRVRGLRGGLRGGLMKRIVISDMTWIPRRPLIECVAMRWLSARNIERRRKSLRGRVLVFGSVKTVKRCQMVAAVRRADVSGRAIHRLRVRWVTLLESSSAICAISVIGSVTVCFPRRIITVWDFIYSRIPSSV
jgi:hypothetical protein